MEITKREILFSTIIVSVMIGLGVLISNPIISSVTENALKITSAIQVKDAEKFGYIRRTNVGDFLAEGKLVAYDPVSIEDIQGVYSKIEKVKEKYTQHERVVEETDGEGHTHTHIETYWEWDRVDSWEWESSKVVFLGETFTPREIHHRFSTSYKETIKPKVKWYESEIRYKYYTAPVEYYGVTCGRADNKSYCNLIFKNGTKIDNIIESAQSDITSAPVIFWVLWIFLTVGLVILFVYFENKWLY